MKIGQFEKACNLFLHQGPQNSQIHIMKLDKSESSLENLKKGLYEAEAFSWLPNTSHLTTLSWSMLCPPFRELYQDCWSPFMIITDDGCGCSEEYHHTSIDSWELVLANFVNTFNQNLEKDPISLCQLYVPKWCRSQVWFIDLWHCEDIGKPGLGQPVQFLYQPHWVVDTTRRSPVICMCQVAMLGIVCAPTISTLSIHSCSVNLQVFGPRILRIKGYLCSCLQFVRTQISVWTESDRRCSPAEHIFSLPV